MKKNFLIVFIALSVFFGANTSFVEATQPDPDRFIAAHPHPSSMNEILAKESNEISKKNKEVKSAQQSKVKKSDEILAKESNETSEKNKEVKSETKKKEQAKEQAKKSDEALAKESNETPEKNKETKSEKKKKEKQKEKEKKRKEHKSKKNKKDSSDEQAKDKKAAKEDKDVLTVIYVVAPLDTRNKKIFGQAMVSEEQCVAHLLKHNPTPKISVSPKALVSYYYTEALHEGIRPDVAFAQALKETGYFRYGGTVKPEQNNYCGLGTTNSKTKGAFFASARLGVRAHIQHLLAYATTKRPKLAIVDPRYQTIRELYGKRTFSSWTDLNGRWAIPGKTYGQSILQVFQQIANEK